MNIQQCEKRNKAIIENAKRWSKGEDCFRLKQLDVLILGETLNIRIPKSFKHFHYSDNPNHIITTGAEKSIFKTLDKIKNKLQKESLKWKKEF